MVGDGGRWWEMVGDGADEGESDLAGGAVSARGGIGQGSERNRTGIGRESDGVRRQSACNPHAVTDLVEEDRVGKEGDAAGDPADGREGEGEQLRRLDDEARTPEAQRRRVGVRDVGRVVEVEHRNLLRVARGQQREVAERELGHPHEHPEAVQAEVVGDGGAQARAASAATLCRPLEPRLVESPWKVSGK